MFLQSYGTGCLDLGDLSAICSDNYAHSWQSVSPIPLNMTGLDTQLLIRNAALIHIITSSKTRPVVLKTHTVNAKINGIEPCPEMLTAGGVYIVRDPRDVAISYSHHFDHSIDESISMMSNPQSILRCEEHGTFQMPGTWSHSVKSWKAFCVVRYEDLLDDPHKWFTEILKGFGLKVKKPRLGKAIRLCNIERMKKQEAKIAFVETSRHTDTFFHHGTSGHWKDILSADQARRIENDHREVMEQYGYLKSNVSEINNVA